MEDLNKIHSINFKNGSKLVILTTDQKDKVLRGRGYTFSLSTKIKYNDDTLKDLDVT
ncbi:hypothetical protein [Bacillus altitudinis]|uniref:hypothetical protein n=1 Tax=Bacillus altitudinis TaxID=293387 RepID=UPI0020D050F3|nr:hypothetical protein [Bacillus altitudinis]